ncbi:MAG: hypothetical protein M8357_10845 [Desulfobulbaceae bacterium]|nr:hypothetical protein [Desulfobulbaceae bacterium]
MQGINDVDCPGAISPGKIMTEDSLEQIRVPALVVILCAAFILRLNLAVKSFFSTFDTSTVGLMALRILREFEYPLFYYGQDYMGALEAYSAAVFFSLFGVSTTILSLAPTFYTLGWVFATYLLFAEISGVAGGLAASLTVAVCGWYPLWFSMATYGGYPATFFFGTLFLWLIVLICFRESGTTRYYILCTIAGCAAALGIWTNFQVFSYLVAGGLVVSVVLIQKDKRRRLSGPFGVMALVAFLGLIPFIYSKMGPSVGMDHFVDKRQIHLPTNIEMFLVAMKRQFLWPETPFPGLSEAAFFSYSGIIGIGLWELARNIKEKREIFVPLAFIPVFLILFLLHPKAATGATRYTIPLMAVGTALFAATAVSSRNRILKNLAFLFLAIWTGFNFISALATSEVKSNNAESIRESRRQIVTAAEDLGLKYIEIIGSEIDGLDGQNLTFYANDRVRFVAILDERHFPSADEAERDNNSGLLCKRSHFGKVRDSLSSAGFSFKHRPVSDRVIIYDIQAPTERYRSVPPREMDIQLRNNIFYDLAGNLFDRDDTTGIEFSFSEAVTSFEIDVTLHSPLAVGGITFYSPLHTWAVGDFLVRGSLDGKSFFPLSEELQQHLPVSRAGNKALIMRHLNPVELRFPAQTVKYLKIRLRPLESTRKPWYLSEMFIFEHLGEGTPVTEKEINAISVSLNKKDIDFCSADPWLSSRLLKTTENMSVYGRYNRRYEKTRVDRHLKPRPGLAFVIDHSVAGEAESILCDVVTEGLIVQQEDFGHYRLFTFKGAEKQNRGGRGPILTWNDHMVLKTTGHVGMEKKP